MSRETLIRATIASSLEWGINETAVDRVVAIAHASRKNELGSLMLRVEALDAQSMRKVILLVVRKLNHRHNIMRGQAERMAKAAMIECLQPHCESCGGRGELHDDGRAILTCQHCGGSGMKRYSDSDRYSIVSSNYNKKAYDSAICYINDSIRSVVSGASNHLTD